MKTLGKASLVAIALLLALVMVGCTRGGGGSTKSGVTPTPPKSTTQTAEETLPSTPSPAPTPQPGAKTMTMRVYLVRGEKIGAAATETSATPAVARAAMLALLQSPTQAEKQMGLTSAIPKGTKLLGIATANGVATVNLSKEFESGGGSLSMQLRAAQVVCTLTQFPSIKAVSFRIDGIPTDALGGEGVKVGPKVSRADFESVLPAILVESPLPGTLVKSPLRVRGSANVFEAQFRVQVVDSQGKLLAEKNLMASSGTGKRGDFDGVLSFKIPGSETGTIVFDELSAKDGKPINVVEIPVRFK